VSYSELGNRIDAFVDYLSDQILENGRYIGIQAPSSPEAVVAVLAVMKSAASFVPIDPGYPGRRTQFIIRDTGLSHVLGVPGLAADLRNGSILVGAGQIEAVGQTGRRRVEIDKAQPNDASCVLYTSGSTGQPKGVIRPNTAITSRLRWMKSEDDDVFCHNMSLNVGFSQERLFLPLMCGLPLAVIPEEDYSDPRRFVPALEAAGVTQLTLTPHSLGQLLDLGPAIRSPLRRLRSVAVGGALLSRDLANRFYDILPDVDLVDAYGSTESGSVIRGIVPRESGAGSVPLGRPVAGATVRILDAAMNPCLPGEPGEIYVEGPSVALGYWNDPELTAQRFLPSPFSDPPGQRMYKTGDRARWVDDGQIEFLGREDRQVKVRGFRVELGEVEETLNAHPGIREAVVANRSSEEDARIMAYVVRRSGSAPGIEALREYVLERLPDYMAPAHWMFLERLPRTLNGKVDTGALPLPSTDRPELTTRYQAPKGALETRIAAVWQEILGLDGVGRHDDFFALGGDSLSAVRMLTALDERIVGAVRSEALPAPLTIARLTAALDRDVVTGEGEPTVRIEPVARAGELPLSWRQEQRLVFEAMCEVHGRPYDQGRTGLILSLEGPLDEPALERAIHEIVRRHEVLRTAFMGDVHVGGLRLGGIESLTPEILKGPLCCDTLPAPYNGLPLSCERRGTARASTEIDQRRSAVAAACYASFPGQLTLRFAINSRTAATSSTGTSMTVCVVLSYAASSSARASWSLCAS
jgi:amino acid adenylation domain-containing protein